MPKVLPLCRLIPALAIPPPKAFPLLPAYLLALQLGDSVYGDAIAKRGAAREEGEGSLQGEIMSSVLDMMSYCECSTRSTTVGITWRQRHHFM